MDQSEPKKLSLEEILLLIKQLSPEDQEKIRLLLNHGTVNKSSPHAFMDYKIDIDQLAQGVPVFSPESLKGDIWPEDEDIEEFLADLRQSRKSG